MEQLASEGDRIDTENLQFRKLLWRLCPSASIPLVLVSGSKLGEKISIFLVMSLGLVWRNEMVSHQGAGMWSQTIVGGVFSCQLNCFHLCNLQTRATPYGSLSTCFPFTHKRKGPASFIQLSIKPVTEFRFKRNKSQWGLYAVHGYWGPSCRLPNAGIVKLFFNYYYFVMIGT